MDPTLFQQLNKEEDAFKAFYTHLLFQKICLELSKDNDITPYLSLYLKMEDLHSSLLDDFKAVLKSIKTPFSQTEECARIMQQEIQKISSVHPNSFSSAVEEALAQTVTERQRQRASAAIKRWNKKI